jgi:hypothetical protein
VSHCHWSVDGNIYFLKLYILDRAGIFWFVTSQSYCFLAADAHFSHASIRMYYVSSWGCVINKNRNGCSNLTNIVIIVTDITLQSYTYRRKTTTRLPSGKYKENWQFDIAWSGLTNWMYYYMFSKITSKCWKLKECEN